MATVPKNTKPAKSAGKAPAAQAETKAVAEKAEPRSPRQRLNQVDVPAYTLAEAMRIPEILRDEYGKDPTIPLDVARAMGVSPTSGHFKMLTGAAVAYGLTDGASQAQIIALTSLGRRVVSPTVEGDDLVAMQEAVLNPRIVREFLEKYNGSSIPSEAIALNVVEGMGVPSSATKRALEMILTNAENLGLLVEIKDRRYVRLNAAGKRISPKEPSSISLDVASLGEDDDADASYAVEDAPEIHAHRPAMLDVANSRVFITHGKNEKIVEQIKKILIFGKFEPVVSVDKQTVAKPVPDKVMDDMRTCGAAIVHVDLERKLLDERGVEHVVVNQNVLIEIGAAMALYGRRFILLVERGATLPSNLQGLYEVRYEGDQLDHDATMKLLEAFNDFR